MNHFNMDRPHRVDLVRNLKAGHIQLRAQNVCSRSGVPRLVGVGRRCQLTFQRPQPGGSLGRRSMRQASLDPELGVSAKESPRPGKSIERPIEATYCPVLWLSSAWPDYSFFVGRRPQPMVPSVDTYGCREAGYFPTNQVMYLDEPRPSRRIYLPRCGWRWR